MNMFLRGSSKVDNFRLPLPKMSFARTRLYYNFYFLIQLGFTEYRAAYYIYKPQSGSHKPKVG